MWVTGTLKLCPDSLNDKERCLRITYNAIGAFVCLDDCSSLHFPSKFNISSCNDAILIHVVICSTDTFYLK